MFTAESKDQKKDTPKKESRFFKKNKYDRLIKEYQSELSKNPKDTRLKLKIAETCFLGGQTDQALKYYEEVANSFIEDNFILKSIQVYKDMLKICPSHVEFNLKLAELYTKLNIKEEATNQYRIAMGVFDYIGKRDELITTAKAMVKADPSTSNRRKLAEVLQNCGQVPEALEQYENLARDFRMNKQYDDLLKILELLLPHKPKNIPLIKDICILYLKKQEPDRAIRIIERNHVDEDPECAKLYDKAVMMKDLLKKQGAPRVG